MKELSIEQKAKAYDSMFERLKEMYNNNKTNVVARLKYERYFPELKENKDNDILKGLIEGFQEYDEEECWRDIEYLKIKDILAWLEKQGEQKFEQKFFINDKVVHKETGKTWTIHWYLADTNSYYVEDNDGLLHHYRESELKLVEQKPWSEENERMVTRIIESLSAYADKLQYEGFCHNSEVLYEQIDWLKSLKDRVQPQPNKEWSEEDEMMIKFALTYFRKAGATEDSDIIKWLKSLRPQNWTKEDKERYISCLQRLGTGNPEQPETINSKWFKEHVYPQNRWKPSKEQLEALRRAHLRCPDVEDGLLLREIIEQLKKLREE